jgi:membrane-associated phospholipid phosphatase
MRVVLWTVVALVLIGRVYVGAHFPLDVTGGAAVGLVLGSLVNLALGVPVEIEPVADGALTKSPHLQ